jgi:putative salt-induced outer membrane protein
MFKFASFSLLAFCLSAATAQAQFTEGLTGEISANGAVTTGNTETTNIGFASKLETATKEWRHSVKASAHYGRANGNTNKSRYALGYQLDRDLNDRLYFFGNADYFSHDFGAFKQGHYLGAGFGYQVWEDDPTRLKLEAGIGYRSQKARLKANDPSGLSSRTDAELAGRIVSDFDHDFNDHVSFRNDTELLYSSSDTFIANEAGVKSKIWENISLLASFRVENHSRVPEGRKKTDTISRLGVVYTMK